MPISGALLLSKRDDVTIKRNFMERFPKVLEDLGLTQKAVAKGSGVSENTVSRWMKENGTSPDLENLLKVCRFTGVPLEALIGDSPELDDIPRRGPVTITLSGTPEQILDAIDQIRARWSKDS